MKAMRKLAAAGVILAGTLRAVASQQVTAPAPFSGLLDEHPAIAYATRPTTDRVSRLNAALHAGDARLSFQGEGGYLRSVLEALGLSPSSQLLVMSKTGIQADFTSPANPRALYFDDSLAVGYIPGARVIELAAHDPEQGVVFYTIESDGEPGAAIHAAHRLRELPCVRQYARRAGAAGAQQCARRRRQHPPAAWQSRRRSSNTCSATLGWLVRDRQV